ncbi:transcription factor WhiB [Streptomyces phaeochromogenes]
MTGPWLGGVTVRRTEWGQTPIADQLCTACGMHRRVAGRDLVRDFMKSNPIHAHRTVCIAAKGAS